MVVYVVGSSEYISWTFDVHSKSCVNILHRILIGPNAAARPADVRSHFNPQCSPKYYPKLTNIFEEGIVTYMMQSAPRHPPSAQSATFPPGIQYQNMLPWTPPLIPANNGCHNTSLIIIILLFIINVTSHMERDHKGE